MQQIDRVYLHYPWICLHRVDDGKNWKVFDFCNMFLQTANELEEATSDLLERLRMENVTYAEIRFCPQLHTLESLTSEEALLAVMKGILPPNWFMYNLLCIDYNFSRLLNQAHTFILYDVRFSIRGLAGEQR